MFVVVGVSRTKMCLLLLFLVHSVCCCCFSYREAFISLGGLVKQLTTLGVLERVTAEPVALLVNQRIRRHVDVTCKGCFDTSFLDTLREWLETGIVAWMDELFKVGEEERDRM